MTGDYIAIYTLHMTRLYGIRAKGDYTQDQQRLSCRFGLLVWAFLINLYFDQKKKNIDQSEKKLINLKNHQRNVQTY